MVIAVVLQHTYVTTEPGSAHRTFLAWLPTSLACAPAAVDAMRLRAILVNGGKCMRHLAGLTALASAGIGACRRRTRTRASSSAATPRTLDHGPRLVVAGNCGAACCWAKTTRDAVVAAAAAVDAGADVYADVYADEMLMLILMLMRMLVLSLVLVLVLLLC